MEAIKDTVINIMQGWKEKKTSIDYGDLKTLLEKLLTKKELRHIKFSYFKKGVLGLRVDSSSWLYSVNLKKEGLMLEFNKRAFAIKDIRFNIGEIK